jgi:hypothetical protein
MKTPFEIKNTRPLPPEIIEMIDAIREQMWIVDISIRGTIILAGAPPPEPERNGDYEPGDFEPLNYQTPN